MRASTGAKRQNGATAFCPISACRVTEWKDDVYSCSLRYAKHSVVSACFSGRKNGGHARLFANFPQQYAEFCGASLHPCHIP